MVKAVLFKICVEGLRGREVSEQILEKWDYKKDSTENKDLATKQKTLKPKSKTAKYCFKVFITTCWMDCVKRRRQQRRDSGIKGTLLILRPVVFVVTHKWINQENLSLIKLSKNNMCVSFIFCFVFNGKNQQSLSFHRNTDIIREKNKNYSFCQLFVQALG